MSGQSRADDTETRAGGGWGSVLKGVPKGVDLSKGGTSNLVPVCLSIGNAGDGEVLRRPTDGPASLGDPDRLATHRRGGVVVCLPESLIPGLDGISHSVLKVWVRVHPDEVAGGDDRIVGAIDPGRPGVHMAHGGSAQSGARDGLTKLADKTGQRGRVRSGTRHGRDPGGRNPIQILTTNGDAGNQAGEGRAIVVNGGRQSAELVGEVSLSARSPQSEKQLGAFGNRRRDCCGG